MGHKIKSVYNIFVAKSMYADIHRYSQEVTNV